MRFLELTLERFGSFTDVGLDFSNGANLHVVYGANEAGKSTALRAIHALLFGIPSRTTDDHLHKKTELLIGATLESTTGERLSLARRKGNKNTLLDHARTPIDEGVLASLLGGVGSAHFETMFGLDHAALVRGGQELLAGEGKIGQLIFGVGVGVGSMRAVLAELRTEADGLFKARGQNRSSTPH